MLGRLRIATGGLAYPLLNRRMGRLALFESPKDYALFETILLGAVEQKQMRLVSYCLMCTSKTLIPEIHVECFKYVMN